MAKFAQVMVGMTGFAVLLCCALAVPPATGELVLHVSSIQQRPPHNISSIQQGPPHNINWFASVAEARDYLRTVEIPTGGATVALHAGYHQPFALSADDSGTPNTPITYTSAAGERAVVSGGISLPGSAFEEWADHPGVLRANLSAIGITADQLGSMQTASMGCVGDCQHDKAELYLDGKAMTLARYPNKAADGTWRFLKADKAGTFGRPGQGSGGSWFLMKEGANASRISNWVAQDAERAWVHGYWSYDWADCYRRLATATRISVNGTTFVNVSLHAEPNAGTGANEAVVKTHARFYGVNLLSELDAEGEYFIDEQELVLYFFPPSGHSRDDWVGTDSSPILTVNTTALINVSNVAHVTLKDIDIAYGRAGGVVATKVSSFAMTNCTVHGVGQNGVQINGNNSEVTDSSIYNCGCAGLKTAGGDPRKFVAGNLTIRNNSIHHVATWKRTYQPPVSFSGCGNVYKDNLVAFVPHTCISGVGTNMSFHGNIFDTCAHESSDVGAFYTCGQGGNAFWNGRGSKVYNNTFKNIRNLDGTGVQGPAVQALYLDDEMSGWEVFDNRFYNCQAGTFIGGGRDNHIHDNYYENCDLAQHFDNRGMGWQNYGCNCTEGLTTCNPAAASAIVKDAANAAYVAAFPEVKTAMLPSDGGSHICIPVNNVIENNRYCKCKTYAVTTPQMAADWLSTMRNNTEVAC